MSIPPPSRVGSPLQTPGDINKPLPPRPLRRMPQGVHRCTEMGYGVPSSSKQPPPQRQPSYDERDPLALGGWFGGSVGPKTREASTSTVHPVFDSPTSTPSALKRTSAPTSAFAIAQRNARRITDEDRRAYRHSSHHPSPPSSPSLSARDLTYRRRPDSDDEAMPPSTPPRSPRLTSKLPHVDICEPDVWLKSVQLQMHSDYDPSSGRYLHRGIVRSARCYGDAGGLREAPALQRVTSQRATVGSGTGRLR